jgi:hypothetical protein
MESIEHTSVRSEVVVNHKWLAGPIVAMVLMNGSVRAGAQNTKLPPIQSQLPTDQVPPAEDAAKTKMEREMAKKANQERQASLKKDTDKLLKLATELKEYVDKTNENMLSMDEKLAHSVKDKMKGN